LTHNHDNEPGRPEKPADVICEDCGEATLEHFFVTFQRPRWIPSPCPVCEKIAEAREQSRRCERIILRSIPDEFIGAKIESLSDALGHHLVRFISVIEDEAGRLFTIKAEPGKGKTHAACAAFRFAVENNFAARYESCPKLITKLQAEWWESREKEMGLFEETISYPGILILDNLGLGMNSDYCVARIGQLISDRYEKKLKTLITTQKLFSRIKELYGKSTLSRMKAGMVIDLDGSNLDDLREAQGDKTRKSYARSLVDFFKKIKSKVEGRKSKGKGE